MLIYFIQSIHVYIIIIIIFTIINSQIFPVKLYRANTIQVSWVIYIFFFSWATHHVPSSSTIIQQVWICESFSLENKQENGFFTTGEVIY